MRSEIPQLEVVTAIADADFEDFVAQLLFSQGWSIIYRAFDAPALMDFLASRQSLRTVVIYMADLPEFNSSMLMRHEDAPFTFISLDGTESAAHAIMQKIRSQLRLPLVQSAIATNSQVEVERSRPVALPKVITVTGSGGAPGRTTLAIALGRELGATGSAGAPFIAMIDADFKSQRLSRRIERDSDGATRKRSSVSSTINLIPLLASEKPTALPTLAPEQMAIVDLGILPALGEVVHDRRWHGSLVSTILESTTHLLYVVRSTEESLDELARFLKEFPLLLRKIPITYICVLVGNSRELRESEARFLTLTTAENRFLIRESQLQSSANPERGGSGSPLSRATKPGRGEVGKIAQSLR